VTHAPRGVWAHQSATQRLGGSKRGENASTTLRLGLGKRPD